MNSLNYKRIIIFILTFSFAVFSLFDTVMAAGKSGKNVADGYNDQLPYSVVEENNHEIDISKNIEPLDTPSGKGEEADKASVSGPGIDDRNETVKGEEQRQYKQGRKLSLSADTDTGELSGSCGDSVNWSLDNGVLNISGTGDMYDYTKSPWLNYSQDIKELVIGEGVTKIGKFSFSGLTGLTDAQLPESIEKIGFKAFAKCTSLSVINIPLNWTECPSSAADGTLNTDYCGHIFEGCNNLKVLSVPEGMTQLPAFAFNACSYLTSVTLPSTLTDIMNHVFYNCKELRTVIIPNGVTKIRKSTFFHCEKLENVVIPNGTTLISHYAFEGCYALRDINLPDSVEKIGYRAFAKCSSITEINIPLNWNECPSSNIDGTIDADYCGSIFAGCSKLTHIEVPEGMTSLPGYAFSGCEYLTSIILPDSLTVIPNQAFYKCSALLSIEIPDGVTVLGKSAFCYCSKLKNVTVPDGVKELGIYAFAECTELESVRLPDSIEKIGYQTFFDCVALAEINIPLNWNYCISSNKNGTQSVSSCGYIFENCDKLNYITVPEGMNKLPDYAFNGCNHLAAVSLPQSMKMIGDYAFANCNELLFVDVPERVTQMGRSVFERCYNMVSAVVPSGLTTVPESTFDCCSSLQVVNIPATVTAIDEDAFFGCNVLTTCNYEGSEVQWRQIQTSTYGNGSLNSVKVIPDFKVTYTKQDFMGMWDGEYDGNHDDMIVRRHFVMCIRKCKKVSDSIIEFFGDRTISQSLEDPTSYYANGQDDQHGYINLKTGAMSFQGEAWMVYPTGEETYDNFGHVQYDGFLEADKKSIVGFIDRDQDRTFYANAMYTGPSSSTNVTMMDGNKNYNLLSDEVIIPKDDTRKVTIGVWPDWMGSTPGVIRLFQKDKAMESMTGVFLDISPGTFFTPDSSIFVALIDANGNTVDTKKLTLIVESDPDSRFNSLTNSWNLQINENKKTSDIEQNKYRASNGAKVSIGTKSFTTNKKGKVTIPSVFADDITVSKSGYIKRSLTTNQVAKNKIINLQQQNNKAPVISGVWIGNTDVLNTTYSLSMLSKEKTTLKLEIDWGTSSYGNVKLLQKQRSVTFPSGSETLTTVISDNFDTSDTIYIVATDSDGRYTKKALDFMNGQTAKVVNKLDGMSFSTEAKLDFKIPDNFFLPFLAGQNFGVSLAGVDNIVPVQMSAHDGIVTATIGFVVKSGSYTGETQNGIVKKTKLEQTNFIKSFKKSGIIDASSAIDKIKALKHLKRDWKKGIKSPKGKFGVDADFTFLGYAEGTYDENGNVRWLDAAVAASPSVSVSRNWPFIVQVGPVPVPMFVEVEFSGEAMGNFNIYVAKEARKFTPHGSINGSLSLAGSLGVGVSSVAYAQGGAEGKMPANWDIKLADKDYFLLKVTLNLFGKAGIGPFSGKIEFDPILEKTIIEYPDSGTNKGILNKRNFLGSMTKSFDYKLKDLDYLDKGSTFYNGSKKKSSRSLQLNTLNSAVSETTLKTNIYKESTPKIVTYEDGTKLAVWIDGSSEDMNEVYLYYSVCEDGVWSQPEIVSQDGTMDFSPDLKLIDDTAYIAWQNTTRSFEESDSLTLEEVGEYCDINVGKFDRGSSSFITNTISNPKLDNLPAITGKGDDIYVVWINNSENDWFGSNSKNSIIMSKYDEGNWSSPDTMYSDLGTIGNLVVDYNEELHTAYSVDTDNDASTSDDFRVYEDGEQISDDTTSTNPSYYDHELYWYANNNIVNSKTLEKQGELTINRYQILELDGQKAMLYVTGKELASELKVAYYNSETDSWGEGYTLAGGEDYIGAFSAASDGNDLVAIANRSEVIGDFESEDPYGSSRLEIIKSAPVYDLSLDSVDYRDDTFCAGGTMAFGCDITNKGNKTISGFDIEIVNANGDVLNTVNVVDTVVPGETVSQTITYDVPDDTTGEELQIRILTDEDTDVSNNTETVNLSFEGVFVENPLYGITDDEQVYVSADVVNRGYHDSEPMTISLVSDSKDGDVIESMDIDAMAPLDISPVVFDVQAEQNDVFYFILKDKEGNVIDSEYVAIYEESQEHEHVLEQTTQKATLDRDGRFIERCRICGETITDEAIYHPWLFELDRQTYSYTGYYKEPYVDVYDSYGNYISSRYYDVSYSNNVNAGTAKAIITFHGRYSGKKTIYYTIKKAANPLKVKAKTATVKYVDLKKKTKVLKVSKLIKFVRKGRGKMTYKKLSGNKKITIAKSTGKFTVKKSLKKGTYKIKLKLKAAGNSNYRASSWKKVTVKIKVK